MSEALMTVAACDRAVGDAEAAIEQLHHQRCRDDDGWCYITAKARWAIAGHLLVRLRALRRREEIERR
jgi:hypothetical protein